MSELSVRQYLHNDCSGLTWGYDKSEADNEICHHKYKRCLAIVSRCVAKSNYHFVLARHGKNGKENNRKSILYSKWRERWLVIAEKFKEAK